MVCAIWGYYYKRSIRLGASFLMYIILFQYSSAKSCTTHKKFVPLQPQNG